MIDQIIIGGVKGVTGRFKTKGKIVCIGGKVGSGKSALLKAIEVVLTGYTDMGKQAGKTFSLSSEESMFATLVSDGKMLCREFKKSGSGATQELKFDGTVLKSAEEIPESLSFPVTAVHPMEFWALSPDKRASFILNHIPEIDEFIQQDELDYPDLSGVDSTNSISKTIELLKKKQKEEKDEIKLCKSLIEKLSGQSEDVPIGTQEECQAEIDELKKKISDIGNKIEKSGDSKVLNEKLKHCEKLVSESFEKITKTEQEIDEKSEAAKLIKDYNGPFVTKEELRLLAKGADNLEQEVETLSSQVLKMNETGGCPLCGALNSDLLELLEMQLESAKERLKVVHSQQIEMEKNLELKLLDDEKIKLALEVKNLREALKSYRAFNEKNSAEALEYQRAINDMNVGDVESLKTQREGLNLCLVTAENKLKVFISFNASQEERTKAELDRQKLEIAQRITKNQLSAVKSVRDARLDKGVDLMRSGIHMTAKAAFGHDGYLDILKGDKLAFDFGIIKNGKAVSFDTMSGGERAIMLIALVAGLQRVLTGKVGIGVFELAEADNDTFAKIIDVCIRLEFEQVFLASCHTLPTKNVDVLIDMDKVEQEEVSE